MIWIHITLYLWCLWSRLCVNNVGAKWCLFYTSKELIKQAKDHPTHNWTFNLRTAGVCNKPTRWNDCGRNPKQRWSAWRTSWPLSESVGPSSPGNQTTLRPTHAPTPGTYRHMGTRMWFQSSSARRQGEWQKEYMTINQTSDALNQKTPSIYDVGFKENNI